MDFLWHHALTVLFTVFVVLLVYVVTQNVYQHLHNNSYTSRRRQEKIMEDFGYLLLISGVLAVIASWVEWHAGFKVYLGGLVVAAVGVYLICFHFREPA